MFCGVMGLLEGGGRFEAALGVLIPMREAHSKGIDVRVEGEKSEVGK